MGARWAWTAVCSGPAHHIYSNFSGGADDCYECGAEPECEWADDWEHGNDGSAEEYASQRRAGLAVEDIRRHSEFEILQEFAEKFGYDLVKRPTP